MSQRLAFASIDADDRAVKRQRIRKGTFSCWECKRRKTKCEFKDGTGSICLSCQRRGTSCIGQEYADTSEHSDVGVEQRINHVESLANRFVQQRESQPKRFSEPIIETENENGNPWNTILGQTADSDLENTGNWHVSPTSLIHRELSPESHTLKIHLLAALPHPPKAAQIFTRGRFFSLPIHVRWQPTGTATPAITDCQELAQISEPPASTAHPVHFARQLIQLALCLHQLDSPDYDAAHRYMRVAIRHVTSQDSLMESIDGIETLMLESCYHINVGKIRHAWLAMRRALAIAQLVGLPLQSRGTDRREEDAWFRLVLADRCLSWMLGLPLGVTDDSVVAKDKHLTDTWTARIQRCHGVVCGRIVTRNILMQSRHRRLANCGEQDLIDDCQATREIDYELKREARCLPIDWWLRPRLNETTHTETLEATGRLIAQMHHNFLLIIAHQPYFVSEFPSSLSLMTVLDNHTPFDHAYSQNVIYSASRRVLEGFLLLRSYYRTLSYRGVDDKVFVAVMMFLLIHVQGHALGTTNPFEHQRPHDLGVIGETISIIEATSLANKDTLSASAAKVLRKLVNVEAYLADGAKYKIWMEEPVTKSTSYEFRESEKQISLPIPYFGFVCIALTEFESPQSAANANSDAVAAADSVIELSTMQENTATEISSSVPDFEPIFPAADFNLQEPFPVDEIDNVDDLFDCSQGLLSNIPESSKGLNQEPAW